MCATKVFAFNSKDELRHSYNECQPIFSILLSAIERDIKNNISLHSLPSYKVRVKEFQSYYRKLLRVKTPSDAKQKLPVVTDLLGIRIVCPFLEDIVLVEQQLAKHFDILEIERKGASRTFSEFGYESTHILISIPNTLVNEIFTSDEKKILPEDLVCEIQIRTILQDAWAEVEHELVYKTEFSPFDLPFKRKLASMNASLSLVEILFQEIRDYQNRLNNELDQRRFSFYEQTDVLSSGKLNADVEITKTSPLYNDIGAVSPYLKGTIDDMILEAIRAHNMGSLDKAIAIYSRILDASPRPHAIVLSIIHKHRGMAYFSKNQYEDAKQDFFKSAEHDPNNFRAFYYIGIVCSVLNNEEESLDFFERSLEINTYQPHVYYRKALSLFHLSLFDLSLENLDTAFSLGLDNEDSTYLRQLLVAKLKKH